MKILELFAGSRSIGKIAEARGHQVYSSDINDFDGIDYVTDIISFDVNEVPWVPDMIWASPPCTYFSVASIGHHWHEDHTPKSDNALLGVKYVEATLAVIRHFQGLNHDLLWYIENPVGKLRKLPVMLDIDKVTVSYCKYGDTRMKPTDIFTNNAPTLFNQNGWNPRPKCYAGNKNCHHEEAPRGAKTGTQGLKNNYERSIIPPELCEEIIIATEKKLTLMKRLNIF